MPGMSKKRKDEDNVVLNFIGNNSIGVTGSCIYGSFKGEDFLLELGGVQDVTSLDNYRTNKSLLEKINFANIKYIFVNHFHQDHSQLVLAAVSRGFKGQIVTNHMTARMLKPLWEDACYIMDTDVKVLKNTKGAKLEPLYNMDDLSETLNYVYEYEENIIHKLSDNISFKLLRNNHVLGSTSLEMFFKTESYHVKKLFYYSDMGGSLVNKHFVFDKVDTCSNTNIAILESTYNDKNREPITKKLRKDDLKKLEVSASTWAVFESVGPFPDTLQNIWGRIYSEWFPSSNYEQAEGPEILWNEGKDVTSPTFKSEIWIPVLKKQL
jgi:Cft2 family RNA processing exonuclease